MWFHESAIISPLRRQKPDQAQAGLHENVTGRLVLRNSELVRPQDDNPTGQTTVLIQSDSLINHRNA